MDTKRFELTPEEIKAEVAKIDLSKINYLSEGLALRESTLLQAQIAKVLSLFEPVELEEPIPKPPLTGAELITQERERQMSDEGWDAQHDDEHEEEELAKVATMYAMPEKYREYYDLYPETWAAEWWKPEPENRIRELTKAGALIAAEIDRLTRRASCSG